jgi:O-methyltransferase
MKGGLLGPESGPHLKKLLQYGRLDEALDFSSKVLDELHRHIDLLTRQQAAKPTPAGEKILDGLRTMFRKTRKMQIGILFPRAVAANDLEGAKKLYREMNELTPEHPLAEPAVEDRYFRGLVATGMSPDPLGRKFRHMVLIDQLRTVMNLPGEIAECGCYRGLSSWTICQTLNEEGGGFDGTGHHIFDSFAGLSAPVPEDSADAANPQHKRLEYMMQAGAFACSKEKVQQHLAPFPGIAYHPGWLPASLAGQPDRTYRFIHLDVDLYDPTAGGLAYFYPRLIPGGVIMTDDYGWPGARRAFDEFCAANSLAFTTFPTDQAILRKPA